MALQVWLPLNKDLKNRGLSNSAEIDTGAVINTNGKIGNCYSCKTSGYFKHTTDFGVAEKFSIAFWIKMPSTITSAAAWQDLLTFPCVNDTTETNCRMSWASYNQIKIFDDSNHQHAWITIEYDKWIHFVIVNNWDGSTNHIDVYKDGSKLGSYTSAKALKIRPGTWNWGSGINATYGPVYYNDIRIYDHALSAEEVNEVYLGKVLDFRPEWVSATKASDASGFQRNMTPHNITTNTNQVVFNGSNSYVSFEGINISGGTISAWVNVPSKPTAQKVIYCDPTSKMVLGFVSNGNLLTAANGATPSWLTTGMTWGRLNHIVATWNSSRQPVALYINGVAAAAGTNSDNWSNSGEIAGIGRRIGTGTADYLNGSINSLRVYTHQLTAEDVKELYDKGPVGFSLPDGYTMLDYIEGTGTQYINTRVSGFDSGDWEIFCKWQLTAAPSRNWAYVFGVYENETSNSYRLITNLVSTTNYYVSAKSKAGVSTPINNLSSAVTHTIVIKPNKARVDEIDYDVSSTGNALPSGNTMGIFSTRASSSSAGAIFKGRIYLTWGKKDGMYKYYMIPCKKDSNGAIGVYDIVTDTFFGNDGSGTFIAGPSI